MTVHVDIERELDRWLGPDDVALPDRVIDQAIGQIRTTSPRRARRASRGRTLDMPTLFRLLAAAALIGLAAGGLLLVSGGPQVVAPDPTPRASAAVVHPPTPSPAATRAASALPTLAPPPMPTIPPLVERYASPTYGYSVLIPADFIAAPASEPWDPSIVTDMGSPWLERIHAASNIATFAARSVAIDADLSTDAWIQRLRGTPTLPDVGVATCGDETGWTPIAIGGVPGAYYHEPCVALWAVVASGHRGYVFVLVASVEDTPELMAPYESMFKAMLGSIELTPETAASTPPTS